MPGRPVQIHLAPLGTYETGVFDQSAAEIVAHDPATQRLFVVNVNSGLVDVLDILDPTDPTRLFDLDPAGGVAAIEAPIKTDDVWVMFFDVDGEVPNALRAGALPDMVTFTPNCRTLLVANKGDRTTTTRSTRPAPSA
jgi:2',3'-cyclic-nucleotide 2'-phosphodiesterase / 3'-nucleotidase / 5'-nucleotidase